MRHMCVSVCVHMKHVLRESFFFFFLSILYKQLIELEKSSQWNIILTSNLWVFSEQFVISSLFNRSEHKAPNHQTCCEQTTVTNHAQT